MSGRGPGGGDSRVKVNLKTIWGGEDCHCSEVKREVGIGAERKKKAVMWSS